MTTTTPHQSDGAKQVRARLALPAGRPMAAIYDPRYSPFDPMVPWVHDLRRALAGRGASKDERATMKKHALYIDPVNAGGKSAALAEHVTQARALGYTVIEMSNGSKIHANNPTENP